MVGFEVRPVTDKDSIGEWREALQPRALPEPDVNLAIHPAPIIQP